MLYEVITNEVPFAVPAPPCEGGHCNRFLGNDKHARRYRQGQLSVITSYSIHYTKLYDLILATTEIHKIPATVLSRCQRYEFRRIPVNVITSYSIHYTKLYEI